MPEDGVQGGDDGPMAVLQAMVRAFAETLGTMDRRLATMEDAMRSLHADQEGLRQLRQALHQLGRIENIEADVAHIRTALQDNPAATVREAVAHLDSFTAQIDLAVQGLVAAVEGRQAGLDVLLGTVRAAGSTTEGMRARVEEARERLDSVLLAVADLPAVLDSLRQLDGAVRRVTEMVEHPDVTGITQVVHEASEMLAERLAEISVSVDAVRRLLAARTEESSHSLGRRASQAGRRFAAELGLAAPRDKSPRPAPGPAPQSPPEP